MSRKGSCCETMESVFKGVKVSWDGYVEVVGGGD